MPGETWGLGFCFCAFKKCVENRRDTESLGRSDKTEEQKEESGVSFHALLQPGLSSPNKGAHLVLTVCDTVVYLQIRQIRMCAPRTLVPRQGDGGEASYIPRAGACETLKKMQAGG